MRSFIIFAFALAMVLALVESSPMENIQEEGNILQMADNTKTDCKQNTLEKRYLQEYGFLYILNFTYLNSRKKYIFL